MQARQRQHGSGAAQGCRQKPNGLRGLDEEGDGPSRDDTGWPEQDRRPLSFGLPAFLAAEPGLNSGMMIAEVTSAALMSENKQLAHPASVDSTPTSANQEDHVSMACHGARRLGPMVANLEGILGIEALTAVQGIEFRAPLATSPALRSVTAVVRAAVPGLARDRFLAPDLAAAAGLVASGALAAPVADVLPRLEG